MMRVQWWHVWLLSGLLCIVWEFLERLIKRRRLRGRCALCDNELRQLFRTDGLSDGDIDTFLRVVSRATNISRHYLRPDDRLGTELAPVPGLSYDDGCFLLPEALEGHFDLEDGAIQAEEETTLHSLLRQIASVKRKQHMIQSFDGGIAN